MAKTKNANLVKARKEKNDEFYTMLTDIEKELRHYTSLFKDKIIYCNCDDCYQSNFFLFFALNFKKLGLKKLICTCYAESKVMDFGIFGVVEEEGNKKAYKIEINDMMDFNGDGAVDQNDIITSIIDGKVNTLTELIGNGDFRSDECIELLKESDIVVTNPPFSLFREFIATMEKYNKKYLVWGNNNAITYKEVFPLIKENKLWLGYTENKTCEFRLPDSYEKYDKKITDRINDGFKYGKVPAISVFTNLPHNKRNEKLILWKTYNEQDYPKYDNYDAINVDKTSDIPIDYDGVMGVPITFLGKYNPDQFEIVGCSANPEGNSIAKTSKSDKAIKLINEGRLKGAKCVGGNSNIYIDDNNYVHVLYHRVFIKRK